VCFDKLYEQFRPFLKSIVRNYYMPGADREDIDQEALFGFYKAVRDYDGSSSSFSNFVHLCVLRQVVTAVKTATRAKHQPLNHAAGIDHPLKGGGSIEGDALTLADVMEDQAPSAHQQLETSEQLEYLLRTIQTQLSRFEYKAFHLWMEDMSYIDIATLLSTDLKAVDNALQRVKRKLEQALQAEGVTGVTLQLPEAGSMGLIPEKISTATAAVVVKERNDIMKPTPQIESLLRLLVTRGGEIADPAGHTITQLAEALGKNVGATRQLARRAVKEGWMETEVRNKRTYAIRIVQSKLPANLAGSGTAAPSPPDASLPQEVDYSALGASLLKHAAAAIDQHDDLSSQVSELEAQVRTLQEANAWLEGEKITLEEKLATVEAERARLAAEVEQLQVAVDRTIAVPAPDESGRRSIDRALRLVS